MRLRNIRKISATRRALRLAMFGLIVVVLWQWITNSYVDKWTIVCDLIGAAVGTGIYLVVISLGAPDHSEPVVDAKVISTSKPEKRRPAVPAKTATPVVAMTAVNDETT